MDRQDKPSQARQRCEFPSARQSGVQIVSDQRKDHVNFSEFLFNESPLEFRFFFGCPSGNEWPSQEEETTNCVLVLMMMVMTGN